jgi:twitching motility protein PilT
MKLNIVKIIDELVCANASDLHLVAGNPPMIRVHGVLKAAPSYDVLTPEDIEQALQVIVPEVMLAKFRAEQELDIGVTIGDGYRLRINVYVQQNSTAAAIRLLPNAFFPLEELGLNTALLKQIVTMHSGLVLVTGATGSGKSTTIASIVNEINATRACHIHTIEDPIEYQHISKMALVTQREVGRDTASFAEALRRSLREDPDVVVVGEMRDLETTTAALALAETGHLTFATLHTSDAVQTVSRIISQFPAAQQAQVTIQLASTLRYVICQQLVPWDNKQGRSLAAEILTVTPAIRALIRDGRTHQIRNAIQTGQADGMQTMEQALESLIAKRLLSKKTAIEFCNDPVALLKEPGVTPTTQF